MQVIEHKGRQLDEVKQAADDELSQRMKGLAYVAGIQAEMLRQGKLSSCAVCNQPVSVEDALKFALEVKEVADSRISGWTADQEQELRAMRVEYARLRSQCAAHANRPAALREQANQVANAYREAGITNRNEITGKLAFLQTRLAGMERAVNDYARVSQARDHKGAYSEDLDIYKRLVSTIDETLGALLARGVEAFEKQVSKYLPSGDTFRLLLWEGEGKKRTETCLVGLEKTDDAGVVTLHTALSGAAWARVTTAVACFLGSEKVFSVIIPAEAAYEGATLRAIMTGLKSAPAQVLITHPTKQKGGKVAGWTVVDVG